MMPNPASGTDAPAPTGSSAARLATGARIAIGAGALFGAIAVTAGAFAAHGLRAHLRPEALALIETGSRYQLMHALALVGAGLLEAIRPSLAARLSASCFAAGLALFCGSLYALGLGAPRWLGMVAPLGGLLLIAGWLLLAAAAFRSTR